MSIYVYRSATFNDMFQIANQLKPLQNQCYCIHTNVCSFSYGNSQVSDRFRVAVSVFVRQLEVEKSKISFPGPNIISSYSSGRLRFYFFQS